MSEHLFGDHAESNGDSSAGTGPLAAEALRLVSSMQDWAQGWTERDLGESSDGHSGGDCQWCPLCQFLAVLRGERPEVTERVAQAGTALAAALRAFIESAASAGGAGGQHRRPQPTQAARVQKINLGHEA